MPDKEKTNNKTITIKEGIDLLLFLQVIERVN